MPVRFRSPGKQTVREKWNTPLLRYLNKNHNVRYRYMGLPGVDIIDLKLWADMIDEIIAFEPPDRGTDVRKSITTLRKNLRILGKPAIAYFGRFEEVVILRKDCDGIHYSQDKVITLYNLDFCDEIASKIETREHGEQAWRFEAIRTVLRDQAECYQRSGGPSLFIILLTIRNQIGAEKIRGFLRQCHYTDTQRFYSICKRSKPIPRAGSLIGTHAWAIKAFLHNKLREYFTAPNISALFFPLVKYTGTPIITKRIKIPSPMLHWMILCKFDDPSRPSPRYYPNSYLNGTPSIRAQDDGTIALDPEPGERNGLRRIAAPDVWFRTFERHFMR